MGGERTPRRYGQTGHRIAGAPQQRHLRRLRTGRSLHLDEKKRTVLARIFRSAIVGQLDFLLDHNLDPDSLAFAEAFLEILLGPQRGAGPWFRKRQRNFVSPRLTLRLE